MRKDKEDLAKRYFEMSRSEWEWQISPNERAAEVRSKLVQKNLPH